MDVSNSNNLSGLFGTSFKELINFNSSSTLLLNDMMQSPLTMFSPVKTQVYFDQINNRLETFITNSSKSACANYVNNIAANISPEQISSSEESSDSSSAENEPLESQKRNTGTSNKNKKCKRNVKKSFIEDPKERASVKYVRKKGLINKLKLYDQLTGS